MSPDNARMAEAGPGAGGARPSGGASAGLLRRRYSVPETIMRKYRLAQQRSDSEESVPATSRSAASASPTPGDGAQRCSRRERELMRKSALLRRLGPRRACCCCAPETRSLDGSRSELQHLSSGFTSSRYSQAAAGWTTPKRQRLESHDFRGSDEMLRTAMRNSYDRAEESRDRMARTDLSDSTYRSHVGHPETTVDAFTDSDVCKCAERSATPGRDAYTQYSEQHSSDTTTLEVKSANDTYVTSEPSPPQEEVCRTSEACSLSDSAETFSATLHTIKDTLASVCSLSVHLARHEQSEKAVSENNDYNLVPFHKPLKVETAPSYETLEIVVSETLNRNPVPLISAPVPTNSKHPLNTLKASHNQSNAQNINIDEYVSNILVESLNSLTDQLECMSASIGSERKISIVEKEIKVKLQNTGVNTIVHLSPMSNNQIIFGNEELCNDEGRRDSCNNTLTIREEALSVESNNNEIPTSELDSTVRCPYKSFDIQHDDVNQAVLQQIQKLFQDELNGLTPADYPNMPEISHIEISDVDVFLDNAEAELTAQREQSPGDREPYQYELISGVGAGNYYPGLGENPVVPRFSALPHTDSMEVNTSSSEDADLIGSECTSLVDSLDDPNSPRSVLLRRANSGRRGELVRSAIDVLDLLPENVRDDETPKDKPESFFIGIKDNECDCDKENVNVADRMPEVIKQRLYRRHRKRELRMECARRSRSRPQRRDLQRDCVAIVNALIDDVITKIAQDEYKCMRIKYRPNRIPPVKSDDNIAKRTCKKELEPIDDREPFKAIKNGCVRFSTRERRSEGKNERRQIQGKISHEVTPPPDNHSSKRIYQKSEIHDGNKCIEILEILEYVNGSQSSSENTNSDENQNHYSRIKKSRIPVPISERSQRSPSNGESKRNNNQQWSEPSREESRSCGTNKVSTDMLEALAGQRSPPPPPPPRRASVPAPAAPHEPRERSNSLRFRQVFDIIPEERSSISLDSGTEELSYNRRASAPDIVDEYRVEEPSERECEDLPPAPEPVRAEQINGNRWKPIHQKVDETHRRTTAIKSAATSPMSEIDADKGWLRSKHQMTMTSPCSKSAATSPLRGSPDAPPAAARGRGGAGPRRLSSEGVTEKMSDRAKHHLRRSVSTQHEGAAQFARHDRVSSRHKRPAPRPPIARSKSYDRVTPISGDAEADKLRLSPEENNCKRHFSSTEKRKSTTISMERSERLTDTVKLPAFKGVGLAGGALAGGVLAGGALAGSAPASASSDGSEAGGALGPPAPRWGPRRARRPPRVDAAGAGAWSVTVAGTCGGARPADVELRLRFPPHVATNAAPHVATHAAPHAHPCQECAPAAPAPPARADSKLVLTMKKEALDSSILASKSSSKSSAQLPDLEAYRAARRRRTSSLKTRRGYSLHCWLPDNEDAPIRAGSGLSVLGCAIVPELKPRARTMSERDLTRHCPRL